MEPCTARIINDVTSDVAGTVQGLASQTSSRGVASFVGQRQNTMCWPPAEIVKALVLWPRITHVQSQVASSDYP